MQATPFASDWNGRWLLALLSILAIAIAFESRAADQAQGGIWTSAAVMHTTACCNATPQFTVNGPAVSIITAEQLDLQSTDQPLIASWSGSFLLKSAPGSHSSSMHSKVDVRLSVQKTGKSNVTLMVIAGDKFQRRLFLSSKPFMDDVIVTARPKLDQGYLVVAVFFAVERFEATAPVLITLDSIDAVLTK
jgi:hypothetical protein